MKTSLLSLCALLSAPLFAQTPANQLDLDFGGDIRFRYIAEDNFPDAKHGQKKNADYTRFRTRLWGKATYNKLSAFLRVGNEFRYYMSKESNKGKQRFPDVTYIDNLYLQYTDAFDFIDIKLGRQDMAFGAKRIISDGTGGDGSRTTFFDAARFTFKFEDKRTLDLFGVYMARHDWLPDAGHTHDAKSKHTKSYDYDLTGYNHNEYGFGLYYTDKSMTEMPWEAYYVWKFEEGEDSSVYSTEVSGNTFQTHTAGFRLLPQFTQHLSGELEVALQVGDESLFAGMAYAGLSYTRKDWAWKPRFTAAVHYMSGDKDGGRGNHAWHPVFNRETGVADSVAPMFDKYAYNNYLYPHLAISCQPTDLTAITAQTGPMFAPVEEEYDGETYGSFRGYLAKVKYEIALGKLIDKENPHLKDLKTSFSGEVLTKGNYFEDDADKTALFFQFEVTYKF